MKALVFLAEGFEEIEALAPADVLRRSGADVTLVSVTGNIQVKGSHGITVLADALFENLAPGTADLLLLPGGMPGTTNLDAHEPLKKLCLEHAARGNVLSAICAAPRIPGKLGLLKGKRATCYPGNEQYLAGASFVSAPVVVDGNIVTASGAGSALEFGLTLVKLYKGADFARDLATKMMCEYH